MPILPITGIASAAEGGEGALVYVEGGKNAHLAERVDAAAILCTSDIAARVTAGIAVLVSKRPQFAFALIGRLLFPTRPHRRR